MRARKPSKPNENQAQWLRRIAVSPLMKTCIEGEDAPRWSLQNGATVPAHTVSALIRNGWVRPVKDGLFDDPQTYLALTPNA